MKPQSSFEDLSKVLQGADESIPNNSKRQEVSELDEAGEGVENLN